MKNVLIKYRDLIPYTAFGLLTTLIDFTVYYLLYTRLGASNVLSTIVAYIAAVIFAFVTNKLFVFKSKSWDRQKALPEFYKFFGVRLGTGIFTVVFMYIFVDLLRLNGPVMKLTVNIFVVTLNYAASKFVIFKEED